MASIQTNIKFVKDLLNSEKVSKDERSIILELLSKELLNYEKQLENDLVSSKDDLIKDLLKGDNLIHHTPQRTVELLMYFTKDNALKRTVHDWDISNNVESTGRSKFQSKIKVDFESFGFDELKDVPNLKSLYNMIWRFLFPTNFGWGEDELNFGWGREELIEFYLDNPKTQPGDFEIPIEYLPKKRTKDSLQRERDLKFRKGEKFELQKGDVINKKINGRFLKFFSDYINEFKSKIEFRGNNLLFMLEDEFEKLNSLEWDVQFEGLKGKAPYTDTGKIQQVVSMIASNIQQRPNKEKTIKIHGIQNTADNFFEIRIEDVGSFSDAHIYSHDKLQLKNKKGQIYQMRDKLVGLCDFSIESRFKDMENVEKGMLIKYLCHDRVDFNSDKEPFLMSEVKSPVGFTYILRFYA